MHKMRFAKMHNNASSKRFLCVVDAFFVPLGTVESNPDSDPRVPSDSENDCKSCKVLSNTL